MGEMHRQSKGITPSPEMVTVTMTMSKPAWAALKMMVSMGDANHGIGRQVRKAIDEAVVVPAGAGEMVSDIARVAQEYDMEKMTKELRAFMGESDPGGSVPTDPGKGDGIE